jgi:DNA-binding MarR family transcriptional regulator
MDLIKAFKDVGLNSSETKVYLYLLESGITTPSVLAKGTKISRTNVYHIVQALKSRGLIQEQLKNNKRACIAKDPRSLLMDLEKKRSTIQEILPDLQARFVTQINKPKVKFYEEWNEVKQVFTQSLIAEKIVAIGSAIELKTIDSKFFEQYQKEVSRRKIEFRDILTKASAEVATQIKQLQGTFYNAKIMPAKYQDIPTNILIWDNNIALLTLKEPVFATILNNQFLASTFNVLADIIWESI